VSKPNFAVVVDQVKTIQRLLEGAGWVVANAVGEQKSPDGVVWFAAGYVYGEYTVTTSYRPRGAGPAEGQVRVRLTPTLVQAHPYIGRELAQDLIEKAAEAADKGSITDVAWPPERWAELAR
jgi:hypothetical protein